MPRLFINVFALWICAMFAGFILQGTLSDLGDLGDGQLARGVLEALERLFWLTEERIGG